ncbi:hypothetical protein ZIOFF_000124 [Zingiber officinale]|uniref:Uncharacterized protein n=1 Tax=Zingiber officinale TaxID=94328 RepID=A0A8J5I473_ZINOF|nr:hypothetical protein ZIOFF_000124 [Zingiber officinale]
MERLRLDLVKESEVPTSEVGNAVYEEIEAPKFVDFTVPDCSPPDDRSWFCSRVGCDQTHEEVDPDALLRSFRLRVMAARTPSARRRKAWDREAPSVGFVGLSIATSFAENRAKTKLKDHPILSLRSTPSEAMARAHHAARKGAVTTSKIQKHLTNQEGYRSMRHPGEPVGVAMDKSVVKSLFVETVPAASSSITNKGKPESTSTSKCEPCVTEVCVKMKTVKVAKCTKNVPSRYLCITKNPKTTKDAGDSAQTLVKAHEIRSKMKLKSEASSKLCNPLNESEVDREKDCNVSYKGVIKSTTMDNCQKDIKLKVSWIHSSCKPDSGAQKVELMTEVDDDKENTPSTNKERVVSSTRNHASKNIISTIRENVPQKAVRPQINSTTETSDQGKHKRTITNPRPFRLRVDERRILKEANHERRLQVEAQAQKKSESSLKHVEMIKVGSYPDFSVPEASTSNSGFTTFTALAPSRLAALARPYPVTWPLAVITREKSTKKVQSRPLMKAPSRQTSKDKSVTTLRKPLDAILGRDSSKTENHGVTSKGRRPATVPREPNFHTIHLPRGCSKRAEWKS